MANHAFFISETYLKNNSPLSANIDVEELYPFMKSTEDVRIQEAIGTKLYEYLIDQVIASKASPATPLSTDDETLIKKLRDVLVWYIPFDALPFIAMKIRNIGVVNQNGENLQNGVRADISYLRQECKEKGDFYLKRVQDYLCYYHSLYPVYMKETKDQMFPNTSSPTPSCDVAFDESADNYNAKYYAKWMRS